MNKATKLQDHKNKKKYEKVINDINSIIKVFNLTQRSLVFFKNYVAVSEIISVIETNKKLLELQQKKLAKELEEIKRKEQDEN